MLCLKRKPKGTSCWRVRPEKDTHLLLPFSVFPPLSFFAGGFPSNSAGQNEPTPSKGPFTLFVPEVPYGHFGRPSSAQEHLERDVGKPPLLFSSSLFHKWPISHESVTKQLGDGLPRADKFHKNHGVLTQLLGAGYAREHFGCGAAFLLSGCLGGR